VTYVTGSAPLFEISVYVVLEGDSLKRIINGCEIVWAGERVFADRQSPPNYGYLFDVSADRKRIVRCVHLPAIGEGRDTTDGETRSLLERDARQAVEEFLRQERDDKIGDLTG
jgi:hypothetical protein